ncbi:hypothetical protein LUZ62_069898 [Rhynchospora pubera]|uniref:NAC domain-containing protein n=1 Tax=Rhynchospora pubera TaxID=906938 RepID=A0AAV8CU38_9POAL|nr:hypothetical protein LUZ62_069898 [Rhynchospora pubera]
MNNFSHVPPGFRFHPTGEELVDYYLRKKMASKNIDLDIIRDVDLYKIEPWDLQELCKIGTEEQNEWYFFSHKDKKYPTGTRTNRATTAGFWKATGRDKPIYAKNSLVGMRKTLVFYKGRAPNGQKSDWIMHEYRLETNENATPQEEGWVVCRVFKKRVATLTRVAEDPPCWFDDHMPFMPDLDSPRQLVHHPQMAYQNHIYTCKPELELHHLLPHEAFLQIPQLEDPNKLQSYINNHGTTVFAASITPEESAAQNLTDWRALDKFVASQLSHDNGANKENSCSETTPAFHAKEKHEGALDYASTSTSCGQNDSWE